MQMNLKVSKQSFLSAIFLLALLPTNMLLFHSKQALPADKASILAKYVIRINDIKLGKFKVSTSLLSANRYSIAGHGKLSLFAGYAFEWKGQLTSNGALTAAGLRPNTYGYRSKTNKKNVKLDIQYEKGRITQVVPAIKKSSKRVPVQAQHLKNALDPMSALIQMTTARGSLNNPRAACSGKIPVFDGQQRFDLQLSYKRTKKINIIGKKSHSRIAYICRVKYLPISGYKPRNSTIKYMIKNKGIEVWLVPFGKADLYVPYYIYIPTPIGTASFTAKRFLYDRPDGKQIAFIN